MNSRIRSLTFLLTLALTFVIVPSRAASQTIHGQVVDSADQRRLAGAFVILIDAAGNELARTIADIEGNFLLVGQGAGDYGIRAEMRGYSGSISARFPLQADQDLNLTIILGRTVNEATLGHSGADAESLRLPEVSVYESGAEAAAGGSGSIGALAEFNARRDRGAGKFITRAEFEATGNPMRVTDVLQRMRGVTVDGSIEGRRVIVNEARGGPRGFGFAREFTDYCPPLFFRDRRYLGNGDEISIDAVVPLQEVLAIEVHENTGTLPATYTRAGSQCGIIAMWTSDARSLPSTALPNRSIDSNAPGNSPAFPRTALNTVGSIWSSTMFQFIAALGVVAVVFVSVGKGIHF